MSTISPNMYLTLPDIAIEPGPDWAMDLNASLKAVDSHNHSPGQGVFIQPNGINISTDLSFKQNNAIALRSVRFSSQLSPITNIAPDVGCLYVSGNELYYNDVSGSHQVQITSGGSVNAGPGSITGLPSGTASVTFSAGTYAFQSATATAANLDARSVVLRNSGASSPGLTLQAPTLSSNIIETLPSIPATLSLMAMDGSGNMSAPYSISGGLSGSVIAPGSITATQIASGTITGTQLTSNINLPGLNVTANGADIVTSYAPPSGGGGKNLTVMYGTISASGTIISGDGFTVTHPSTGHWTVTFTPYTVGGTVTGFSTNPAVILYINGDDPASGILSLSTSNSSGFTVTFGIPGFGAGDIAFNFIAIGQRIG